MKKKKTKEQRSIRSVQLDAEANSKQDVNRVLIVVWHT